MATGVVTYEPCAGGTWIRDPRVVLASQRYSALAFLSQLAPNGYVPYEYYYWHVQHGYSMLDAVIQKKTAHWRCSLLPPTSTRYEVLSTIQNYANTMMHGKWVYPVKMSNN